MTFCFCRSSSSSSSSSSRRLDSSHTTTTASMALATLLLLFLLATSTMMRIQIVSVSTAAAESATSHSLVEEVEDDSDGFDFNHNNVDDSFGAVFIPFRPCGRQQHRHDDDDYDDEPCWMNMTHPTTDTDTTTNGFDRGVYLLRTNRGNNFVVTVPRDRLDPEELDQNTVLRMETTSQQAQELLTTIQQNHYHPNHDRPRVCMNGGPFDGDGKSSGPVVVNRTFTDRTKPSSINSTNLVGIGLIDVVVEEVTDEMVGELGNHHRYHYTEWALGTFPQIKTAIDQDYNNVVRRKRNLEGNTTTNRPTKKTIRHFVSGFDWIVYRGRNAVGRTRRRTKRSKIRTRLLGIEPSISRAPRTAIGIDKDNNLIMIVVDGCEHCFHQRGPTLSELADLLIERGAQYAINMDGGGSTTMVMYQHRRPIIPRRRQQLYDDRNNDDHEMYYDVINHPTCLDVVPIQCERKVVSVVCV